MNITRAFSFVFDDPDWISLIVVIGLLQIVPVFGQIVALGCILLTARAIANGSDRPLPRLQQFGAIISEGLIGAMIIIGYYVPILIIACGLFCLIIGLAITTGQSEPPVIPIIMLVLCASLLLLPLSLITQPLLLVGAGQYLKTGSPGAAFRLGAVLADVRRHPAEWLVLWLLSILCNFVAGLGGIALFIGILFTTAYAAFVFGHLLGQTVRQTAQATPSLL